MSSHTIRHVEAYDEAEPAITPGVVHQVAARETLWSIAEIQLGTARRWRDVAVLNYGRPQVGGGALAADHWLQPGWELLLPADPASTTPVQELTDRGPSDGTAGAPPGGSPAEPNSVVGQPSRPGGPPVVPVGAGIVGVGMADLVDRLRRVQQRHRVRGGRIRLPDQLLRPLEQRLRLDAGAGDLEAVEAAVVTLADVPGGWPEGRRLTGATVGDGRVRLTFDVVGPADAPAPFTTSDDGLSVSVDRAALGPSANLRRSERQRFMTPTLVSVGRADGDLVMVDLEGLGAIAIAGDPITAEGLGRAIALELASSRWASGFDLVLVGFGAALANGDRVTVSGDAGPVIADLAWRRLMMSVQLDDAPGSSVDSARRFDCMGDWRPIVVVCAPVVPPGDVGAILDLAGDGRLGICAVAMADVEGRATTASQVLRAGPTLKVLGALVEVQTVDGVELDHATQLIETAAYLDADGADDEYDTFDADGSSDSASPGDPNGGARSRTGVASYGRSAVTTTRVGSTHVGSTPAAVGASEGVGDWSASARVDRAGIEVEVAVLGPWRSTVPPGSSPGPGHWSSSSTWPCIPPVPPMRRGRPPSGPTG